jgi:hypothetical protein
LLVKLPSGVGVGGPEGVVEGLPEADRAAGEGDVEVAEVVVGLGVVEDVGDEEGAEGEEEEEACEDEAGHPEGEEAGTQQTHGEFLWGGKHTGSGEGARGLRFLGWGFLPRVQGWSKKVM